MIVYWFGPSSRFQFADAPVLSRCVTASDIKWQIDEWNESFNEKFRLLLESCFSEKHEQDILLRPQPNGPGDAL